MNIASPIPCYIDTKWWITILLRFINSNPLSLSIGGGGIPITKSVQAELIQSANDATQLHLKYTRKDDEVWQDRKASMLWPCQERFK